MASVSRNEAVSNFSWRYIGRLGGQIISFVVTIVLARLIAPEAFGAVAIVTIFTSFLQVFVDSGLGSALVQKKTVDDLDFSSVFYFNFVVCILLYVFLYISSSSVAIFYDNSELSDLLRVSSLILIIVGLRSTQETYVTRYLLFKKHFVATTVAIIISAAIGIAMAYFDCGAWSIVGQQLSNTAISTVLLWLMVPWRPKLQFSFPRLKSLLSFGVKILVANLVDTIYSEVRSLLIGKIYSAKDLAFYDRGKQFPYLFVSGANGALKSVMLPILSREQDELSKIKNIIRKTIRITVFFISSILAFLFCSAESLTVTLLTENWLPIVPYLRILCFDSLFWPIISAHYNSFQAVGRSDIYMNTVVATKIFGILLLVVVIKWGVFYIALSSVLAMVFQELIVAKLSKKFNKYGYREQISDIISGLIPAFVICVSAYWINVLDIGYFEKFIFQSCCSFIVFILYGKMSKAEGYIIIENLLKTKLYARRKQ